MGLDRRIWIYVLAAGCVAAIYQFNPSLLGLPVFKPTSPFHHAAMPSPETTSDNNDVNVNQLAQTRADTKGLEQIITAYRNYQSLAEAEIPRMKASYDRLNAGQRGVSAPLNYLGKLAKLSKATRVNAGLIDAIADLGVGQYTLSSSNGRGGIPPDGALFRSREALLHLMRDWSEEGRYERDVIMEPILDVLRDVPVEKRGAMRVLVPGAGLGRLAWEVSQLGFDTTANELSWYMVLALQYLLNPAKTPTALSHTFLPFAHRFSNQRSNTALFRTVSVPDVLPSLSSRLDILPGDFFALTPPSRTISSYDAVEMTSTGPLDGYDIIVTQFFIDTGSNVAALIQQIHTLLSPGGRWINLGPLHWVGGGQVSLELNLEEVLELSKLIGFEIEGKEEGRRTSSTSGRSDGEDAKIRQRRIDCEYTADREGMFRRVYEAEFWVARKAG